ncbi:MAG: DUF6090 family protein [Robiginitalea sp.]
MLRFFRQIRQRLLTDNKFSKYLLYAIGEILLVVIGILIALQVNNWNEDRIERKNEVKLLKELKADLDANLEEIAVIKRRLKRKWNYSDSIMIYIRQKREVNDSLKKYIRLTSWNNYFNNSKTTYEYIKSTGLKVLSNDSLRSQITKIYEEDFQNIEWRKQTMWKFEDEVRRPFMRRHFKPDTVIINEKITSFSSKVYPENWAKLCDNIEFKNIILDGMNLYGIRINQLNKTIESLNNLILNVQREIDNLEGI